MAKRKNRVRKSTKYIIILASIIALLFSLNDFFTNLQEENMNTTTKQIYKYTNRFNYDYDINLISNKYMTNEEVKNKDLVYVTDLIKNIKLNLNYDYLADKNSDIECKYSVEGIMQAFYTKNGEEQKIWETKETILKEKKANSKSNNNIKINEILTLDLKDKNELINNFKQQLGMNIVARYTVCFKINVATNIDGQDVENEFSPILNIDLAEKTTKITGENNTENTKYISGEYKFAKKSNAAKMIFEAIIIIGSIFLLRYALKSEVAHIVRNEYKLELNRILKICQDKIVQISTKPNDEGQEVVYVKDFGEIVKVSEELFKPILYYTEKDKEEAWFSVMSGKTSYRFILRK